MTEWSLVEAQLKKYRHFDCVLSVDQAVRLATGPFLVKRHSFYPFIHTEFRWTKYAKKGVKGKIKKRPIRYAARGDAYIFSRYRAILAEKYEARLAALQLGDSVLAYRKIVQAGSGSGKCNIHHAKEVFDHIAALRDCHVMCLDVSDFFESLDHERIKEVWCELLGTKRLPEDHDAVFKAVTKYSYVNLHEAYERLGYFGPKYVKPSGEIINGFLLPAAKIPKQLCKPADFRAKIAGSNGTKSIIKTNYKNHGIPQGSPISDLISNFYLLKFDQEMNTLAQSLGGIYRRYSDDIIFVIPQSEAVARSVELAAREKISTYGAKLLIKESKSSIHKVITNGKRQIVTRISGESGKNGIEYLGFRYDGIKIFIRDSTISNLLRKIAKFTKVMSRQAALRYPDKAASDIFPLLDIPAMMQHFGRVREFEAKATEYDSWTFWTYAKRAIGVMGDPEKPIARQLRRFRKIFRASMQNQLDRAVAWRAARVKKTPFHAAPTGPQHASP